MIKASKTLTINLSYLLEISYFRIVKQALYKIASSLMSLLVLFSTLSFTVEKHYCGDMLIDMAIMHKSTGCAMEKAYASICDSEFQLPGCCKDEHTFIEGQNDLKLSWDSITLEDQHFIIAFTQSHFQSLKPYDTLRKDIRHYRPPLIIHDHQVLNESFLI